MRVCATLIILTAVAAPTVSAQSLADVARRESERRQAVSQAGKTYTNDDLPRVPAASPPDAAGSGASAGAAPPDAGAAPSIAGTESSPAAAADAADSATADGAPVAAKPDTSEVKNEAYWSDRMAELKGRLERDQTFAEALQNRIDALTTDFVNRDDPAQRGQIASDRQKALTELERLKRAIEQDRRAIPELEEEARRAGVPAGWLRE